MSDAYVYMIFIDAPLERVWEGLTSGAFTRQYWAGRRIESDWRPGSPFHLYVEDSDRFEVSGEVVEADPPHRLVYTWRRSEQGAAPPARITFELEAVGDSVRLLLTHAPMPAEPMVRQGWAAIMSSLKSYLETGQPLRATALFRPRAA